MGKKILFEKNRIKKGMGFELENVYIPKRVLETFSPVGLIDESYLREAAKYYKEIILS